jgi:hypothetical protein
VPTVVVDSVVIAAWAQVVILAALAVAAFGALRWATRRITRRRWHRELGRGFDVTARAVEMAVSAVHPDAPCHCAEPSSGESGLSR